MRILRRRPGIRRSRALSRSTKKRGSGAQRRSARRTRGAHGSRRSGASPRSNISTRPIAWPLNPQGELLLGVKLEDKYALANADETLKIPGIAFAEWGPGTWLFRSACVHGPGRRQGSEDAAGATPILAACKANKMFFLNTFQPDDVIDMIKEGVMVGPASKETAEIGRKYTKREMPW